MNRRRILQAFAAATFAAVVEVMGTQAKVEAPTVLEVNPEYLTAKYEQVFIWAGIPPQELHEFRAEPLSVRFKYDGDRYIEVPKCIKA